ncbi:uncharacterized protein [Watersipora subatra]|uniref:uncharacterized protein n=1 Tax=Watersipora subatra TaxID=2589382 RepID=UPI00355B6D7A
MLTKKLDMLHSEYGADKMVEEKFRDRLEQWPKISGRDFSALKHYSYFLNACVSTMNSIPGLNVLNQKRENRNIIRALLDWLSDRWVRHAEDTQTQTGAFLKFKKYAEFIAKKAKYACSNLRNRTATQKSISKATPNKRSQSQDKPKSNNQVHVSIKAESRTQAAPTSTTNSSIAKSNTTELQCQYCISKEDKRFKHLTAECLFLAKLTHKEIQDFITEKSLCFGCLETGHRFKSRFSKAVCKECKLAHATVLHGKHEDKAVSEINRKSDTKPNNPVKSDNTSDSKNTQPSQTTENKMKVHLFGAKSSPACATYGLRYIAHQLSQEDQISKNSVEFITENLYVDDGILSVADPTTAIQVLSKAIEICHGKNGCLHKVLSNIREVVEAFLKTEQMSSFQNLDLNVEALPTERTLGMLWNSEQDCFQYEVNMIEKPNTRRGILSNVASIFDPLGLVSPVLLQDKSILEDICKRKLDWDDALDRPTLKSWSHLTNLMIDYFHCKTANQGAEQTLALLRTQGYWIPDGRSAVSSRIRGCVTCKRIRGQPWKPH